ncbi:putative non-specific serine/threonine protein kinase [Helianthus debilis subsp. tardiflorus]
MPVITMGKKVPSPNTGIRISSWTSCMVILVFVTMAKHMTSQSGDENNTLLRDYCRLYNSQKPESYIRSLNTVLSSLQRQLSDPQVYYAFARTMDNGDLVYAFALCREYLSTSRCLACFELAVNKTKTCGLADGGSIIYDDCSIRHENSGVTFGDSDVILDDNARPEAICSNVSASQPIKSFNQVVQNLLSDIRDATPRTSNFYIASTRQVPNGNTTVYAIAQCVKNTSFFQSNQTTNIRPFLSRGSSSNSAMIVGVSSAAGLVLLILALLLWYRKKKKLKTIEEAESGVQSDKSYSYQQLRLATHDFGDEFRVGKGGFGEVFKVM